MQLEMRFYFAPTIPLKDRTAFPFGGMGRGLL
jgi:hypothetical protein